MKFIPVAAISSLQIASLLMGAASATSSLSSSSSSSAAVMAGTNTRLSQKGVRSVLKNARRLEQQGDDANNGQQDMDEAEVEAFLMDYSMKFMTCVQDQEIYDTDGYLHYGAVIIRLCPSGKCDDDKGCKSGYADFAVDVGTYVAAYMEDQADNMNWDDQFDADSYGQCTEYLQNDDEDGNEGSGAYIGPGCTQDGSSVRMAVFVDQYCSTPATESAFAQISDGWTLPYSDGGLVSTECTPCTDYNNADQLREMCMDLYYEAPYRCEDDFDFSHYYYDSVTEIYRYGKDKTGCTPIELMQKQKNTLGGAKAADLIFAIFLLLVAVGGFAYYTIWWRKQKENLEKIDDDESTQAGDSAYQHHDDDDESRSEHRSGAYEAYTAPQPAGEMA
eukprot:CAMPEP_0113494700 /NCGR_PEP_ID=MMETSP0014_2-20120614/29239_1 /TAXON_ID=2857 /ORGANISM="Nitzschia sp." /LENGTH=388 /DNA_ID=CAMNT_0000388595 /DNA_START=601 /DNA_END=1767 /DNA_ORIENTATION=+ /assembly_acc=CAM_ASM_000159